MNYFCALLRFDLANGGKEGGATGSPPHPSEVGPAEGPESTTAQARTNRERLSQHEQVNSNRGQRESVPAKLSKSDSPFSCGCDPLVVTSAMFNRRSIIERWNSRFSVLHNQELQRARNTPLLNNAGHLRNPLLRCYPASRVENATVSPNCITRVLDLL